MQSTQFCDVYFILLDFYYNPMRKMREFISPKLLMKSPRFREVKQGVVEVVSAEEKKKRGESSV